MEDYVNCPYCEAQQYVCHDDGENYNESGDENYCTECEKTFIIYCSTHYSFESGCKHDDHDIVVVEIDRNNEILGKYKDTHKDIDCKRKPCDFGRLISNEEFAKKYPNLVVKVGE